MVKLIAGICVLLSIGLSVGKLPAVKVKKELTYYRHTLADTYTYNKTIRTFQWDKISEKIDTLNVFQKKNIILGLLVNYKNINGTPPLAKKTIRNKFGSIQDTLGVERSQNIPLYRESDLKTPERYGRDGSLISILQDSAGFSKIKIASMRGVWMVPQSYIRQITPGLFKKIVFVDRKNQNISTLEYGDSVWLIRSMNPATTGLYNPPYQKATPTGIFVVQKKMPEMYYLKDGTTEHGGFAPFASRFTNGAYLHGVPVNTPSTQLIEFSPTLGTTPRSHMCVRNATSHAKFLYDWAPVDESLVIVFD